MSAGTMSRNTRRIELVIAAFEASAGGIGR
jgi:hypothetical protein